MATIKYPFGSADEATLTATGDQAVAIANTMTIIDGATAQATGNRTIDLTIDSETPAGAQILVKTKSAATETLTFGDGFTAPVHTGVAGKTFSQAFIYDGTTFKPCGAAVQLD
jgi:hypothetical protein